MLKRVTFIFEKEDAKDKIKELLKELAAHNVQTYVVRAHELNHIAKKQEEKKQTEEKKKAEERKKIRPFMEEMLYITDSAVCQKKLKSINLPVIIYLHEGNRWEDFTQAEYAIEQIEEIEYQSLEAAYLRMTGQPWHILTTDRCEIRETITDDIESFYEIYKEPSITYYMEDLYADKDEEIAYIREYIKNIYGFYGYGIWTVLEKRGGQVIGRAGISLREGYDIPELGFVISVPYQCQGYAYEVCHAILMYGQEKLGFSCFQVFIMEGNEKSKALCVKLGFLYQENVEIDGVKYERMLWGKS